MLPYFTRVSLNKAPTLPKVLSCRSQPPTPLPHTCQASIQSGVKAWMMWRPAGARLGSSLRKARTPDKHTGQRQQQMIRATHRHTKHTQAGKRKGTRCALVSAPNKQMISTPPLGRNGPAPHSQCRDRHKQRPARFLHVLPRLQQYVVHISVCTAQRGCGNNGQRHTHRVTG